MSITSGSFFSRLPPLDSLYSLLDLRLFWFCFTSGIVIVYVWLLTNKLFIVFWTEVSYFVIDLFINSDAILNRDALWSIQGKKTLFTSRYRWRNTPYIKNIAMNVFLVTMRICQSIF